MAWKSPCIIPLALCRNQKAPTDFAEEPKIYAIFVFLRRDLRLRADYRANFPFNTDWRDKVAPVGQFGRYAY